jgi:hypothetical protein
MSCSERISSSWVRSCWAKAMLDPIPNGSRRSVGLPTYQTTRTTSMLMVSTPNAAKPKKTFFCLMSPSTPKRLQEGLLPGVGSFVDVCRPALPI